MTRRMQPFRSGRARLLRALRSAYAVPMFVIEFLPANTAPPSIRSSSNRAWNSSVAASPKNTSSPTSARSKARVHQRGTYQVFDKVSVALKETDNKYWATLANINLDHVNINEELVGEHDRLLMGGVWAEVTLRYNEEYIFRGQVRPFFIDRLKPIQLSNSTAGLLREARKQFTREEWIDLLIRSLGMEPTDPYFTPRRKMLYLLRLLPLIERNYNLIELGPRGTGKAVYQQVSPYCHLVSGGQTTVAQLFVNLATGQRGLVALWDTVAFDEAAGIRFSDKNGINILKNYMEDGSFHAAAR